LLLFPANRVTMWIFFWETVLPAWILLGLWFLWQVIFPQEGVANWAHAGGFVAGMMTVLVLGGRQKVLKGTTLQIDPDDY
jgi:membrane associated rhomboid family serine protease